MTEEAKRVIKENIESLMRTYESVDENYTDAAQLIANARKVIVSGIGKSGLIAKKIAATFTSLGIPSLFLHPVEALHGDIGIAERGDVAILLSKSGSTEELCAIAPYLKQRTIKIVSIIGNVNSHLADLSDIVLDGSVEKEACRYNVAPTTSTLVALAIGDALGVCAMALKKKDLKDFAKNHPKGQLGKNLTIRVKDIMHTGIQLPIMNQESDFRDVLIVMSEKKLGCCCIVNDYNEFTGIITDGDVRRILQKYPDIRGLKSKEIMTKDPVNAKPDIMIGEALAIMEDRESQISVLPIVNHKKECIGVIRIHDIIKSGK